MRGSYLRTKALLWCTSPERWRGLVGSPRLVVGLAILLVVAGISCVFHDPFDFDDRPNIERVLKLAAAGAQADLAADMERRIEAQARLAQLHDVSKREWQLAGKLFLDHYPGYIRLEWVDRAEPKQGITVTSEDVGNGSVDILEDVREGSLVQSGSSSGDLRAATTASTLPDGRPGYLIAVPSSPGGKRAEVLVAVADLEKMLDATLSHHAGLGYSLAVIQGSDEVYKVAGSTPENRQDWSQVARVPLAEVNWLVQVWPKPAMLAEARSQWPELGAIFALLLLLLLTATIQLAKRLRRQSGDLQKARDELEQRVRERTAELQRTNHDLRNLSAHVLHLQDEERRRIARELHDSTAQTLSALKINLSSLRKLAAIEGCHSDNLLQQSGQLAEQALNEVRSLSYLLHPPILEDFGLESALSWYAEGFRARSGIEVRAEIDPDLGRLSADLELILFRTVQEGLSNIHRHSGSPTARIVLSRTASDVSLLLIDEGCGLPKGVTDPEPGSPFVVGVGIAGMRERVTQFGGRLEITSTTHGTTLRMVLPVRERQPFVMAVA